MIVLKDGRFSTFKNIDPHNRKGWRLAMGFERLLFEKQIKSIKPIDHLRNYTVNKEF